MEITITRIIETLLLPPTINIIMIAFGFFIRQRFFRSAHFFMVFGFISLVVFSIPKTATLLSSFLESTPVITLSDHHAQAIVVLGGGRYSDAAEYKADTVSMYTLTRLNYAVYLHKKTQLPLLLSGGSPYGEKISEAELMQQALQQNYSLQARWVETQSSNTQENASLSFSMLQKHGLQKKSIQNIILVTHAAHMPRAKRAFSNAGFKVTAAPMGFQNHNGQAALLLSLLPSAASLNKTQMVLREYMGQLWYLMRY